LFQKIQDARAFAVAGGQSYRGAMILNVAFTLVFNTGLFPDACRAWQVCPAAQNTWIKLKVHFLVAHQYYCLTNKTAHQSRFHSANMMIENHAYQGTVDAIAQLAVATASDCNMMAVKLLLLPQPQLRAHIGTDKSKRPESHSTKDCARACILCLKTEPK
jgi:hypothetical protein